MDGPLSLPGDGSVRDNGASRLKLTSEVDMAAAPGLRAELGYVVESSGADVVVDLADVTFMDSTALSVLIEMRGRLASAARRLRLERVPRAVRRLLDPTGVDRFFDVAESDVRP